MRNIWQPNETIEGRYRLERLIGRGGVGEVWLAEDKALQRKVAIKTIISSQVSGEQLERFSQEARLIAKLNHPGISAIYDVGRDKDYRFIVMEFVDGRDLSQFERGNEFPLGYGIRIALQVSRALLYAHQNDILHRDIKPHNILIEVYSGDAKLTDFGIAKNIDSLSRLTATGQIFGTPAYMSPEQISGQVSGPQSDIYSLGMTLYELFTGKLPFKKQDILSSLKDRVSEIPDPPIKFRSDIPKRLSDAIVKMLQPDSANRMGSISEFIPILEKLSEEIPASKYTIAEGLHPSVSSFLSVDEQSITSMGQESPPPGFFNATEFPRTQFFADDEIRYSKIQESLEFYREHLNEEYQSLVKQANTTYKLWIVCVCLGFLVLCAGVISMISGHISEGVATTASTIIVYFIQRIFQQREDHYRSLAKAKNSHLEYGNQWLLVIQSVDSIQDPSVRIERQAKLVDVLTDKLSAFQGN